jgi:hypothetical protein
MTWKTWKKSKLNSENIWKIRKKDKLNNEWLWNDMENMENRQVE